MVERFNDAIHGGVVVDGWAGVSTTTTFAKGTIQVKLPVGATVRKAWLVSSTGADIKIGGVRVGALGDLSPVPGLPREVVLSSGATSKTMILEGSPNAVLAGVGYGSFSTEVTAELKTIVGVASGAALLLDVAERGDGNTDFAPSLYGHTVVVVYDLASVPLRNVWVGIGALGNTASCDSDVTQTVMLARPSLVCQGQPAPLSITVTDEPSNSNDFGEFYVNSARIATRIGGADDAPDTAPGGVSNGYLAEMTTGSVGASGALGIATGLTKAVATFPTQTDDVAQGVSDGSGRREDELFDLSPVVSNGSTSISLRYKSATCTSLNVMVFETNTSGAGGGCDEFKGGCGNDNQCGSTDFCDDTNAPHACLAKLPNGAALPGGSINAKCTEPSALRACASATCETSDNRCGLLLGSACESSRVCRSGLCQNRVCATNLNDAGIDSSADAAVDSGTHPTIDAGIDAMPLPNQPGADVQGGGLACSATPGDGASLAPLLVGLMATVAALRKKRG